MPCHPNDWTKQQFPPPTHFFIAVQIVYRVLGVSLLLPFPSQISKKKKCPELKCRAKERAFLWESYVTTSCVYFSFFSLPQILKILWICVCVCAEKTRSFWTKIYRRRQWVCLYFFFFWQHPFWEFVLSILLRSKTANISLLRRPNDSISKHASCLSVVSLKEVCKFFSWCRDFAYCFSKLLM